MDPGKIYWSSTDILDKFFETVEDVKNKCTVRVHGRRRSYGAKILFKVCKVLDGQEVTLLGSCIKIKSETDLICLEKYCKGITDMMVNL